MRRTLARAAALAVTLGLTLVPDMAAAGTKADSTITITTAEAVKGGTLVEGRVTSEKRSCKRHRTVKVYHDVAPPGPSSEDFLLGTVKTNRRGKWALTTAFAPDKVYAKVRGTDECKRDRSPTRTVTP